ncbi:hypothetical protein J2R78_002043 [Bradyrhizobium sp. USDA 4538]|nr:hypothetical protein [Bradyrhizobium sp. USDA 4538]
MRKAALATILMCRTIAIAMRRICMTTRTCSVQTMLATAMITIIILAVGGRMVGKRFWTAAPARLA